MQAYNIVLIRPAKVVGSFSLSMAFDDVSRLLCCSFQSLGIPCTCQVNVFEPAAVNVILGYQMLEDPAILRSQDCIIYQLESLPDQPREWLALDDRRLALLQAARAVWDYSPENIAFLAAKGLNRVKLLPLGFHEQLQTVPKTTPDIDVFFYGAVNVRRKAVLDALARKCRTKAVFGVYGEKRDQYLGRSRIILNLHQSAAQLMEQVRVSYLLNNRCFVVSEETVDNPYAGALVTAAYDDLVDCCLRYLDDPGARDRMAEAGFAFLAQRPMVAYLQAILE
jgi:hypothetical protein